MNLILETLASVTVTPRTTWLFAVLSDGEGSSTTVETTYSGNPRGVSDAVTGMASILRDEELADESEIETLLGLTPADLRADPVSATAVSGLRTAVAQLTAMRSGLTLSEYLGARPTQSVELYANINRALFATERTPADFGIMAERASRAGFRTVKCAPFDEVNPPSSADLILGDASTGIARVRAVREAIGPRAKLLVDCHGRFDRDSAPLVAEDLAKLDVGWFEEPVDPESNAEDLAEIARWAKMPIAGGESGYGSDFFDDLLDSEAVSIIMPDVKHCGGAIEAVTAGRSAILKGRGFSMHSPSGPVSLLASGHATAAVMGAMPLEHAVYEADWRADLIDPPERIENGHLALPNTPGLGATLNSDLLRRFGRIWEPA